MSPTTKAFLIFRKKPRVKEPETSKLPENYQFSGWLRNGEPAMERMERLLAARDKGMILSDADDLWLRGNLRRNFVIVRNRDRKVQISAAKQSAWVARYTKPVCGGM